MTRKLSYRKADRAMRLSVHMGALNIFWCPWQRPRLLLPKFL